MGFNLYFALYGLKLIPTKKILLISNVVVKIGKKYIKFDMEILNKILIYLGIRKHDSPTDSINLKIMHGINRISIYLFMVCLGLMLWKLLISKML